MFLRDDNVNYVGLSYDLEHPYLEDDGYHLDYTEESIFYFLFKP
jgi:hypothetical protein